MNKAGSMALACALAAGLWIPAFAGESDEACADCHGKDGASTEADVPVIGGLSEQYLKDSMAAYKAKKRPCPESRFRAGDTKRAKTDMCRIAAKLSDAEIAKVSKDLAGDPFVRVKQTFDAGKVAAGKKVHDQACEKCHSKGGGAAEDDAGILAGQWRAYTKQTMADMMSGKRVNPAKMKAKTDPLKPGDVEALLDYYASEQ